MKFMLKISLVSIGFISLCPTQRLITDLSFIKILWEYVQKGIFLTLQLLVTIQSILLPWIWKFQSFQSSWVFKDFYILLLLLCFLDQSWSFNWKWFIIFCWCAIILFYLSTTIAFYKSSGSGRVMGIFLNSSCIIHNMLLFGADN